MKMVQKILRIFIFQALFLFISSSFIFSSKSGAKYFVKNVGMSLILDLSQSGNKTLLIEKLINFAIPAELAIKKPKKRDFASPLTTSLIVSI